MCARGVSREGFAMLPSDPIILFSCLNTLLRDRYPTLDELCAAEGADRQDICARLAAFGYEYSAERNQFV